MGTRDATVTGIRKHGVSNPLGWDGDTTFQMPFNGFPVVSNPQGWDGDWPSAFAHLRSHKVSNPQGWDGDATKETLTMQ